MAMAQECKLLHSELRDGSDISRCIGRNLAFVEIYKTVSELVRKYDMTPKDLNKLWNEELKLFLYKKDMIMTIKRREI